MKRFVAYPLLVFLALLIFYGGAGVNLVSYCCADCEDEGVEAVVEEKCCDIHEHVHTPLFDGASNPAHTHGCDIERVSFDWNSVDLQIPVLQPIACDLFFSAVSNSSLIPSSWVNKYVSFMETGPPIVCPRTYLSLLTSLLI